MCVIGLFLGSSLRTPPSSEVENQLWEDPAWSFHDAFKNGSMTPLFWVHDQLFWKRHKDSRRRFSREDPLSRPPPLFCSSAFGSQGAVDNSSFSTYARFDAGCSARCRGPEPGGSDKRPALFLAHDPCAGFYFLTTP